MRLEAQKYLFDIQQAANRIARFCEGKKFEDYRSDELLRSAVERQFEIMGEALSQLHTRGHSITPPKHMRIALRLWSQGVRVTQALIVLRG